MMDGCCNRICLLGVDVDVLLEKELLDLAIDASCRRSRIAIGHHNLHSIYIYHHNSGMRRFYGKAAIIHIDGMPIIWAGRLLGHRLGRKRRLTSLDWILRFLRMCADRDLRVFLLGSQAGVGEEAALVFQREVPRLKIAWHHGHFDKSSESPDNVAVIRAINDFNTHVLLVGMGMPEQENWISDNIERLNVNVAWALGGFMDYFAGVKPVPPRWMGRVGLEWLSRLCSEPARLWWRYLIEPLFVLRVFLRELVMSRFWNRHLGEL